MLQLNLRKEQKNPRSKAKWWFITYPQWLDTTREKVLDELREIVTDIEEYVVAKETHEDGNPHYHVMFKSKKGISKTELLRKYEVKYPDSYKRVDVATVRNRKACYDYLFKEDRAPLEETRETQRREVEEENRARLALTETPERRWATAVMIQMKAGERPRILNPTMEWIMTRGREVFQTNGTWKELFRKMIEFKMDDDAETAM